MDEFEHVLRRYRPGGPPAELRSRVLGGEPVGRPFQGRRWRAWLLPAAAAAAAVLFYALTDSTHRRVMSATLPADIDREAAIAEMAANLGGDEPARLEAERLIAAIASANDAPPQGPVAIEENIP